MEIYSSMKCYYRFIELVKYYRFVTTPVSYSQYYRWDRNRKLQYHEKFFTTETQSVVIHAFCLMPNHYHLLLEQKKENGISSFMRHIQDGYAKYYNLLNQRSGPLFQSSFKAVHIISENQFTHTSRYIHLNPSTSYLVTKDRILQYPWSSLSCYVEQNNNYDFVDTTKILSYFVDKTSYKNFVFDQIDYQRKLKHMKEMNFEC